MGSVATRRWSQTRSCATLQARHLDVGPTCVLELSGEADVATLGLLRDELEQVLSTGREEVVVDLAGLAFCDVASAHLLLTARGTHSVTLSGATRRVTRVLELVESLGRPTGEVR